MSLLKRVNDRKVAAKQAEEARHPIVKLGADRNVREAYFGGLAFAAVANDDAIDDDERRRLVGLGSSLELPSDEVAQTLNTVSSATDDEKMALIEECARQIDDAKVADLFLKEFEELWKLGGGRADEYKAFRTQLIGWMGASVGQAFVEREQRAVEARKREAARKKAKEEKRIAEERALAETRRAEKERIDLENTYETLRRFADECISTYGKKFSRAIFAQVRNDFKQCQTSVTDMTLLFVEIGRRLVSRIEALGWPNEQGQDSIKIAQETVWMLVALSSQRVLVEEIPIKPITNLLGRASRCTCDDAFDLRFFWNSTSGMDWEHDNCEGVFCHLLGVPSVFGAMFTISKEHRKKLEEWKSGRRSWPVSKLEAYARDIGISPYACCYPELL